MIPDPMSPHYCVPHADHVSALIRRTEGQPGNDPDTDRMVELYILAGIGDNLRRIADKLDPR